MEKGYKIKEELHEYWNQAEEELAPILLKFLKEKNVPPLVVSGALKKIENEVWQIWGAKRKQEVAERKTKELKHSQHKHGLDLLNYRADGNMIPTETISVNPGHVCAEKTIIGRIKSYLLRKFIKEHKHTKFV